MGNKGPFTTPQIAEVIEVPQRKMLSFIERGYVSPSVQEASGHGSKRLWSYEDLIRCAVIKFLSNQFSVDSIRMWSSHMKADRLIAPDQVWFIVQEGDEGKPGLNMVTVPNGQDPFTLFGDEMRRQYPVVTVVDFGSIHTWVKDRLSKP